MDTINVESETQALVTPAKTLWQASLYINRKHLLNASLFKHIAQREIPFYGFVQQPPTPLRPFSPMVDMIHSEISGFNMPLGPYGVAQPVTHGYEAPIMAVPISCITPEGFRIAISNNHESVMDDGRRGMDTTRFHQLSYSERKENWYIRSLQRSNEIRSDLYYVHVRTNKQFRSLKEVNDFVMHGQLPNRNPKGTKASDASSRNLGDQPKRIRGDKLIDRVKVGIYNLTNGKVHRTGTPPTASNSEESNNSCLDTENKKRKRIEEISVQQFREANSSEAEDELFVLYDMEPKHKQN
ncbi:Uncharacterized protein Adt_23746 [Abeliophyllum distichum]|uniref:Uncharacterized protein n=1 Tax=Abeliophyllum distichum TaxID=126358 RepID=A0ABD1SCJ8_9LAMI